MNVNNDKSTYNPPFSVVLLDAMDAYYYADIVEKMEQVATLEDYGKAVALADALFVTRNYDWESLKAMNDVDGGMTSGFMTARTRASTPPTPGTKHSGSARAIAGFRIHHVCKRPFVSR